MASSRIIWNGNPGEVWVNRRERFAYQLIVAYHNSCGFCIQYDRAICNWWPLVFHRECRCKQFLIKPGDSAQPFIDFRERLRRLPRIQQTSAIGRSNLTLLEKGIVTWEDIVTESRVRSLAEVVKNAKLDLKDLLKHGVRPDLAEHAMARINTPKQIIVREQRAALIEKIAKAGLSPEQIKEAVSVGIGKRISIAAGPSRASVVKPPSKPSKLPEDLRAALAYFGRKLKAWIPKPKPKPVPPKDTDAKPPDIPD